MKKLIFSFLIVLLSISGCTPGHLRKGHRDDTHFNRIFNSMSPGEGRAKFAALRGNFTKREMKQIAKALEDNGYIDEHELSPRLRQLLFLTGNERMFR